MVVLTPLAPTDQRSSSFAGLGSPRGPPRGLFSVQPTGLTRYLDLVQLLVTYTKVKGRSPPVRWKEYVFGLAFLVTLLFVAAFCL